MEFMSTKQLAAMLGVKELTMHRMRWNGGGPAFVKVGGRIRYLRDDVETWVAKNRVPEGGERLLDHFDLEDLEIDHFNTREPEPEPEPVPLRSID